MLKKADENLIDFNKNHGPLTEKACLHEPTIGLFIF